MTTTKLCINCRHFIAGTGDTEAKRNEYSKCAASPKLNDMTFVDGREPRLYHCSTARLLGNPCGPEGKLFEPKPIETETK